MIPLTGENIMNYRSIKIPSDFAAELEIIAKEQCRSLSQQLVYWAKLGRKLSSKQNFESFLADIATERYEKEKNLAITVDLNDL